MKTIKVTKTNSGRRLDRLLLKEYPNISKSLIYRLIRKKDIKINQKRAYHDQKLNENDEITIFSYALEDQLQRVQEKIESLEEIMNNIEIIYEDENIIVIYKEAGILSQADQPKSSNDLVYLVNQYLRLKYPDLYRRFNSGSINRLDRNTEGLIIFGKNYEALNKLNDAMQNKNIHKFYLAVVKGKVNKEIEIKNYLQKNKTDNFVTIYEHAMPGAYECKTKIRPLAIWDDYSLIELKLLTGRSHQLRAQLAYMGTPIVGDSKYGNQDVNSFFQKNFDLNQQWLIAYKISFTNLVKPLNYLNYKTFTVPEETYSISLIKELFSLDNPLIRNEN